MPEGGGGGDACIFVPKGLGVTVKRRDKMTSKRAVAIQLDDVALATVHLPWVDSAADSQSQKVCDELLAALDAEWMSWCRRKRPPRHFVLAMDANVELPNDVPGITGPLTWKPPSKRRRHREQCDRIFEFAAKWGLRMVNTWPTASEEPGEARALADGEQQEPQRWTYARGRKGRAKQATRRLTMLQHPPKLQHKRQFFHSLGSDPTIGPFHVPSRKPMAPGPYAPMRTR